MFFLLTGFWLAQSLYHIISTVVGYGLLGGNYIDTIAIVRDGLWFGLVALLGVLYARQLLPYLQRWWKARAALVVCTLFAVGLSRYMGQSVFGMLVGIKYGLLYLFIFLTATWCGFALGPKMQIHTMQNLPKYMFGVLGIIVILGLIWQGMKWLRPDIFFQLGYGPVGDFVFGQNPPIYYRTGPGGWPRLQGLFAGPNNYGYFLLCFFPFVLQYVRQYGKQKRAILVCILRGASIAMTLSRAALLGTFVALLIIYRKVLFRHRYVFWLILVGGLGLLIGLSLVKHGSSLEHIQAKLAYIPTIITNPLGFGLGNAGPAVHHAGLFLPENYYLQLLLDIGTVGFLLRCAIIYCIYWILQKYRIHTHSLQQTHNALFLGFYLLLLIGIFLHVFEDSMVNYLFFIPFGFISGLLSHTPPSESKE